LISTDPLRNPQKLQKIFLYLNFNLNKHIAITRDGKVVSCPELRTVVTNRMEIDGGFTMEQAGELSDKINAGR
jgi:preprotein translocase subunit SecD